MTKFQIPSDECEEIVIRAEKSLVTLTVCRTVLGRHYQLGSVRFDRSALSGLITALTALSGEAAE